jgi:hypothetical protein
MKVINVRAFVPGTRRAIMTRQLDGTVVKDRIDVGGLDTYYEVHGAGEPLMYVHGGFNTIEMLSEILPAPARQYRVDLPERQGRGRTPDRDGPITYRVWPTTRSRSLRRSGYPLRTWSASATARWSQSASCSSDRT